MSIKKITSWKVDFPEELNNVMGVEHTVFFSESENAKRFETALNIAEKVLQAGRDADVELCTDGQETIIRLILDGLWPEDLRRGDIPVFLNAVSNAVGAWAKVPKAVEPSEGAGKHEIIP